MKNVSSEERLEKRKQYQKEYAKKGRKWYLSRGICPICRKADVVGKLKACGDCLEKFNSYQRAFWANRDRNAYMKELRQRHIANGMCARCGKNKPEEGYVTCSKCLRKERYWRRCYEHEHQIRKVKPEGICRWCDEPVVPGKKLCQEHYAKMRQVGLNMREHVKDNWFVKTSTIYHKRRVKSDDLGQ